MKSRKTKQNPKVGDLVLVHWLDSRGVSTSWREITDIEDWKACKCKSVGWLIQNNKKVIHIVPHTAEDPNQGCGDMVIPKSQIIGIWKLSKKER